MARVTYKDLYTQVAEEIDKRILFNTKSAFGKDQLARQGVQPLGISQVGATSQAGAQEVIQAVQTVLEQALPQRIISGLTVTATDPISANVVIAAGIGTVAGQLYELDEDVTVPVPFNGADYVLYINFKRDTISVDPVAFEDRLNLAKIVIRDPNAAQRIRDTDNGSLDAYIVQFQPVYLYHDGNGKLEEDSKEFFKDNIGDILAETIVGTITLNENLKITNVAGTLELDSTSLNLFDFDGHLLSKFNQRGVYFYNTTGIELAKFTADGARIGNIVVTANSLQSGNFMQGAQGFRIKDNGDVEFNGLTVRGTIYALAGSIGGFTIEANRLYGGTIQTSGTVGAGANGVVMDTAGLRGYNSILGEVFNLPTDGSAPTFSSGIIRNTIYEINTNAVLRTSDTVGDGSANSYGILINNTGLYGVGANQTLSAANLKALIDGTISLTGIITATSGQIGNVTISSTGLSGGLIQGSTIRAAVFETSASLPKIRIDTTGIFYQVAAGNATYGLAGSGLSGFEYGSGTLYGTGVTAYLFNQHFPVLSIESELTTVADIRLYNRSNNPVTGTHEVGDLIVVNGKLKICTGAGSPGTFTTVGTQV